ncbi:MAG: T9SS type A sorting domain-containing protein [Bacteroidia bacterium]|nr:T9SS type A sorting domain-containing protein [Bacteroidia bacterium]
MKKQLLFISSGILLAFASNAQITITTADIAGPFTSIRQANDTVTAVSAGTAGASQTWDLSALATDTEDTMTFLPANYGPNFAAFPGANLAIKMKQQGGDAYVFANNSASSLTFLGTHANIDFNGTPVTVNQFNTPAEILTNFPATYNSTFNNNYTQFAQFYLGVDPGIGVPVDSIRLKSVISKTSTVDGWGSVTTPLGTFSALRVVTTKYNSDTLDAQIFGFWNNVQATQDSSKTYTWWANGIGFPLAEITVDFSDVPQSATWLKVSPAAGINEYTNTLNVNIYPNPAQNVVYFATKADKVNSVQVFDINGKLVRSFNVTNDISTLDISELSNGLYTYSIIAKDLSIANRGKFTVAK